MSSTEAAWGGASEARALRRIAARWRALSLSTEPADRPATEAALAVACDALGMTRPEIVLWAESPHVAARHFLRWREACVEMGDFLSLTGAGRLSPAAAQDRARTHWVRRWAAPLGPGPTEASGDAAPDPDGGSVATRFAAFADTPVFRLRVAEEHAQAKLEAGLIEQCGHQLGGSDLLEAMMRGLDEDYEPEAGLLPAPENQGFGAFESRGASACGDLQRLWHSSCPPQLRWRSARYLDRLADLGLVTWPPIENEIQSFEAWVGRFPLGPGDARLWAIAEYLADVRHVEEAVRFAALARVMAGCGFCWLLPGIAFVTERPSAIRLDRDQCLHCEDGPALVYPDGWSRHALHGVLVPARYASGAERITARDIADVTHAGVRRTLLDRFGVERFLHEIGARVLHQDRAGTLVSWRHSDGEPMVAVLVTNATVEPDGTRKRYLLRVPPTMTTAREAVAWTFGRTPPESYAPVVET